jgi:phosphatidylethanolamine/phosphatidyl-N-methylethanolamine N-methyltransferase
MAAAPPARGSIYDHLAPLYDFVYGAGLQPGRRRAMAWLAPRQGERILEVGIGTGLGARAYPDETSVLGVDLSAPMLRRASRRLRRHHVAHVSLARMDAAALALPDGAFDAVYAPYIVNVVPDPVRVGRELRRVCRAGGRIVLLNHFSGAHAGTRLVDRLAGRIASGLGDVDWQVDLQAFLCETGLVASVVERVNVAGVSSLVVCRAPSSAAHTHSPSLEAP